MGAPYGSSRAVGEWMAAQQAREMKITEAREAACCGDDQAGAVLAAVVHEDTVACDFCHYALSTAGPLSSNPYF